MGRPEVPNPWAAAQAKRARRSARHTNERAAKRSRALQAVAEQATHELKDLDLWSQAVEVLHRQLAAIDHLDAEELAAPPEGPPTSRVDRWADQLAKVVAATPIPPMPGLDDARAEMREAMDAHGLGVVQAPPGTGKTEYIAEILAKADEPDEGGCGQMGGDGDRTRRPPALALVQTKELAKELADRTREKRESADLGRHLGRQPIPVSIRARADKWRTEGKDLAKFRTPCGGCWQLPAVEDVSKRNHVAMGTFCLGCLHYEQYAANDAWDNGHGLNARAEHYRHTENIREAGVDPRDVPPCGHFPQLRREEQAAALIGCHPAFSESIARYKPGDGEKSAARGTIWDEQPELVKLITVRLSEFGNWEERLSAQAVGAARQEAGAKSKTGQWAHSADELAAFAEATARAFAWAERLAEISDDLRRALGGAEPDLPAATTAIEAMYALHEEMAEVAQRKAGQTAQWERVRVTWQGLVPTVDAPLRALTALHLAAEHGLIRIEEATQLDGAVSRWLVGVELTPAGTEIIKHRQGKVTDGTPSPGLCAGVEALGGKVKRIHTPHPVRVFAGFAPGWGRGLPEVAAQRTQQAAAIIPQLVERVAEIVGVTVEDVAVTTHMPWADAVPGIPDDRKLHWGAERGTNKLKDARAMVSCGLPSLPPSAMRDEYEVDRSFAVLAGAPAEDWPAWNDERELGVTITVGGQEVVWPGGLPADLRLRAWELDFYARKLVQANARLRASSTEPAVIVIPGPCPDLSEWGMPVTVVAGGTEMTRAPSPKERGAVRHVETHARIAAAMREGKTHNDEIIAWLFNESKNCEKPHGTSNTKIREVRDRIRAGETVDQIASSGARAVGHALRDGVIRKPRADLPRVIAEAVEIARKEPRPAPAQIRVTDALPVADDDALPTSPELAVASGRSPPIG